MSQALRIIFAGTPEFAAHYLDALLESKHDIIAVYSQPDRPAGRGKKLTASPVKELAVANNIPVLQPLNFKAPESIAELEALNADLMVVVAYGLILPKAVLAAPRLGCINVHASLLPRWRGAAPIQRAIEAGDSETGVTIMQMDVGLDTGDMLVKVACPIAPDETGGSLHDKLVQIGRPALLQALDQISTGTAVPEKQDDAKSNYAPKLNKEEAVLDWRLDAAVLERRVRAFNPFPICTTRLAGAEDDQRIRVWRARAIDETRSEAPGTITQVTSDCVWVACGQGQLILQQVQLPGKKPLAVAEVLRGHPDLIRKGDRLELPYA